MNGANRVLVTGGAGLIGSHVVDLLTDESRADRYGEIVVLDNFVRGRLKNLELARSRRPLEVIDGDIGDRELLRKVMRGADLVFHLAAIRITQCAEEPRLALETLVNGTFNVLEAAAQAGVKRVIASSSASVYGMAERFPTPEAHHPYNNRTLYGAAKAFNEALLRTYHDMYGLDYVALRYFNVYGPRMDIYGAYTEVLIRWMERIESGQPPLIFGDGTQTMDFVHVRDIARSNLLAAESGLTDQVFNIASGTETSLNQLAVALARAMGSDQRPVYAPERKVNPVPRRLADTTRAKELLGFSAETTLEEGLMDLVNWWRAERGTR